MKTNNEKDQAKMPEETTRNIKPFSELNLMDDFMFDVATMDLQTCKDIIELCLNIKLREIHWKESQKVVHNLPDKRDIRLDFYVVDVENNAYDVEMQAHRSGNLPKRTRFYRALLDSPVLKSGEKLFDGLRPTYIIFICCFDLFGYGKYRYTFESRCREVPELVLKDDFQTVFLNTKGNNRDEVETSLVEFLRFVEDSSEEAGATAEDARIRRIAARVCELKGSAEMELNYMKAEERYQMLREEGEKIGKEIGKAEGRHEQLFSQVRKKLDRNKTIPEIADALEEDESVIRKLVEELQRQSSAGIDPVEKQ